MGIELTESQAEVLYFATETIAKFLENETQEKPIKWFRGMNGYTGEGWINYATEFWKFGDPWLSIVVHVGLSKSTGSWEPTHVSIVEKRDHVVHEVKFDHTKILEIK